MRHSKVSSTLRNLIGADECCVGTGELLLVVGYPFPGQYAVTISASTPQGRRRAIPREVARLFGATFVDRFISSTTLLNLRISRRYSIAFGVQQSILDAADVSRRVEMVHHVVKRA